MNWNDEIVEEVRKVREEYAARFNYSVAAICKDLEAREKTGRSKIADLQPLEPEPQDGPVRR